MKTIKDLTVSGDYNTIKLKQVLSIDSFDLDTFWKRLRWLFTGRVGTFIDHKGETKRIISNNTYD
ncbi:hypothetical protein KJ781_04440 [Patescibacteria group bacterium]|nr:hypothetical protein [Patescibacteria group bacterium]MBU1449068.1 hypothetical protein [Patescibacteria group bacterium]